MPAAKNAGTRMVCSRATPFDSTRKSGRKSTTEAWKYPYAKVPKQEVLMRQRSAHALTGGPSAAASWPCVSGTSASRRASTSALAERASAPEARKAVLVGATLTIQRATSGPTTYPTATATA